MRPNSTLPDRQEPVENRIERRKKDSCPNNNLAQSYIHDTSIGKQPMTITASNGTVFEISSSTDGLSHRLPLCSEKTLNTIWNTPAENAFWDTIQEEI